MLLELAGETDENGMLLDYYEMDKIVNPILNEYDHALVLDNADERVIALIDELKFKYKIIDVTSTSENLAAHFIERFKQKFSEYRSIKSITVRVYETYDAYAEVTKDLR
jgi:6-pyruvoyltetrahydropterin/6-carboxytetrahydropterin synthase